MQSSSWSQPETCIVSPAMLITTTSHENRVTRNSAKNGIPDAANQNLTGCSVPRLVDGLGEQTPFSAVHGVFCQLQKARPHDVILVDDRSCQTLEKCCDSNNCPLQWNGICPRATWNTQGGGMISIEWSSIFVLTYPTHPTH